MRAPFFLIPCFFLAGVPANAFAHAGHLGELAGHGHWIALAAGGVAVTIAAALVLLGKEKDRDTELEPEEGSDQVADEASGS